MAPIRRMKLSWKQVQLPLKHQFVVAYSQKSYAENVFIQLEHDGVIGYGEAAPSYFYHESAKTVVAFLEQQRDLLSQPLLDIDSIMWQMEQSFPGNYAAKAAINLALYDILGKQSNLPVHRLLGIHSDKPMVTSFTIGIDSLSMIQAKVMAAANYPILKIKLGSDHDEEIIETVRQFTSCPLRIDANEGWTREQAVAKIRWLEQFDIEIVEQPLPANDIEGTRWVRKRVGLPIFADESFTIGHNLEQLVGAFDGVNIKLMKCGGISAAVKLVAKARALGLKTMLGCFIESSLGISAAAQIAPLFDYLDVDGALLLKTDPFDGVKIVNGWFKLPQGPGLGATPVLI